MSHLGNDVMTSIFSFAPDLGHNIRRALNTVTDNCPSTATGQSHHAGEFSST
jgi:hypothetical protein